MKSGLLLLLVLSIFLLYPKVVAAQFDVNQEYEVFRIFIEMVWGSGFPRDAYTVKGFLQAVVFPFLALFAIMYGILSEIRIFRTPGGRKAQIIIALMGAFLGGYYSIWLTRAFLQLNAFLSTVAFGIVFFIGIIAWAYGRGTSIIYDETGRVLNQRLIDMRRAQEKQAQLSVMVSEYSKHPNQDLLNQIKAVEKEMDDLERNIKKEGEGRS